MSGTFSRPNIDWGFRRQGDKPITAMQILDSRISPPAEENETQKKEIDTCRTEKSELHVNAVTLVIECTKQSSRMNVVCAMRCRRVGAERLAASVYVL